MADPYAFFSHAPLQPSSQGAGGGYEAFSAEPPAAKPPPREQSPLESGLIGAAEATTFGFGPAAGGAIKAGEEDGDFGGPFQELLAAGHGLFRMATGDKKATETYRKERDRLREEAEQAYEQNPKSYIGGELAGSLVTPMGKLKGATLLERVLQAGRTGAVAGGLGGVGDAVSRGDSLLDTVKGAAGGAAVGGLAGTVAAGGLEAARAGVGKVRSLFRGATDVDAEAARQIRGALGEDLERKGASMTAEERSAARAAGTPRAVIDVGGEATRDLARTAANKSSSAWDALHDFTENRFREQAPRIAGFVDRVFGGIDNPKTEAALKEAYERSSGPNYAKAYKAGDRPIISDELERLLSAPAVGEAMAKAVKTGQNRAVLQGLGAFRPYVQVTADGRVNFPRGPKGVPAYPNIQLWDYTQRELQAMAQQAEGRGRTEEAGYLKQLVYRLNTELDSQVPMFQHAREGASWYFGATNAMDAGRQFVMQNIDLKEAGRMVQQMTPVERQLFARGFAGKFVQEVLNVRDKADVLNRAFISSPAAKQKLAMAMGPERARQVETLLRVEAVLDRPRQALGNSTTAKQLAKLAQSGGHAAGTAGAVAGLEYFSEGGADPAHVVAGLLVGGALKHGATHIDERVARRIGEMLVSKDPAILDRGIKAAAGNPRIFRALQEATRTGARVAAHQAGPTGAAALGAAALERFVPSFDHPHSPHEANHPDNWQQQ